MIKHIVLFQLKPSVPAEEKSEAISRFKTALENLMGVIDELRSIEVGVNRNPKEAWDVALVATFDSMEDLHAYTIHPEHLKAGAVLSADVRQARACVDFVINE